MVSIDFNGLRDSSRRSGDETVHSVNGCGVSVHQMADGFVHQPLTFEHTLAGKRRRRHFDLEVAAGAGNLRLRAWYVVLDCLAKCVEYGTLEICRMR